MGLTKQCVPKKVFFRNHSVVVKRASLCFWEYKLASTGCPKKKPFRNHSIFIKRAFTYYASGKLNWLSRRTATQCTQRIIDEFNVLRQQPEIVRNALRHGGHVKRHGP